VLSTPPPSLLGALGPMPLYFGLTRLAHWSQLGGVVAGVVLGLVLAIWRMAASRKVEQLGLFATAVLALSLVPSIVIREPRIVLAAQTLDGYFAASCFLLTAFTKRPLVVSMMQPAYAVVYRVKEATWNRLLPRIDDYRRQIRIMSYVCAATAVLGSSLTLALVLNFPIDTVVLVGPFIGFVVFPLAFAILSVIDRPIRARLKVLAREPQVTSAPTG
jgi:hypothetical protein